MRDSKERRAGAATVGAAPASSAAIDVAVVAARLLMEYGLAQAAWRAALRRYAVHNPDWANHSETDPGITLLQLFAFGVEDVFNRSGSAPGNASRQDRVKWPKAGRPRRVNRGTDRTPSG